MAITRGLRPVASPVAPVGPGGTRGRRTRRQTVGSARVAGDAGPMTVVVHTVALVEVEVPTATIP